MEEGIFDKKHYTEKIKDFPIWKLINLANITTNRLIQIKKQGNKSDKKKIKKLSYKRSLIYRVLLEKLKLWEKDGSNNEFDLSNYLNFEELFELST